MPCLLGFLPVMNEVQAGAVTGGTTDSSSAERPVSTIFFKFGMYPCCISGRRTSNVAPSRLIRNTFFTWACKPALLSQGRRRAPEQQYSISRNLHLHLFDIAQSPKSLLNRRGLLRCKAHVRGDQLFSCVFINDLRRIREHLLQHSAIHICRHRQP